MDREALGLTPQDRVLVITSAGCNALDYALVGRARAGGGREPAPEPPAGAEAGGHPRARLRARSSSSSARAARRARGRSTRRCARRCPPRRASTGTARSACSSRTAARGRSFYYRGTLGPRGARAHALDPATGRGCGRRWSGCSPPPRSSSSSASTTTRCAAACSARGCCACVGSPAVMSLLGVPEPQRRMVVRAAGRLPGVPARLPRPRDVGGAPARELLLERLHHRLATRARAVPRTSSRRASRGLKAGLVDNVTTFTGTVTECLAREARADHRLRAARPHGLAGRAPAPARRGVGGHLPRREPRRARDLQERRDGRAASCRSSVLRRLRFERERAVALHRLDRVGTYASFHIARFAPAV